MAGSNTSPRKRLVWRISDSTPEGAWVNPNEKPASSGADPSDVINGGWVMSSYDLLNGLEVCESKDVAPGELFDRLFGADDEDPSLS
jgi:hypothetical protein